ncbi:hypothetical protein LCL97_06765 [Seohaeicola saemankumensis]|nr:hypothetical protein [Seohaeicola saemankumensis]MCA0870518.1 hypothetical protein [Seohaeicola saemankumensis]
MKPDLLPELAKATHAMYLREHDKVKGILKEEAALRLRLAQLDEHARAARETGSTVGSMRAIGADILWQAWEERTRRALNMELARVMARKLAAMDRVRTAFGRKTAVANLSRDEKETRRFRERKKFEASLLDR